MGADIEREHFHEADFVRFERKLGQSLVALGELLSRPGFGQGAPSIGAELELDLVDEAGLPRPINASVLAEAVDSRVTLEVNRFNLEVNSQPALLAGRPFSALAADLGGVLAEAERAAVTHDVRTIAIGILPTLTEAALHEGALSDRPRFRALSRSIRQRRSRGGNAEAAPLLIQGDEDRLSLDGSNVTFEGANTSFQVHLRSTPAEFARLHTAAQIATGPVLAAAGNSPLFLGHRLWEETRVALFRQSIDDRGGPPLTDEDDGRPSRVSFGHGWVRESAWELFAENVALHEPLLPVLGEEDPLSVVRAGGVPKLEELRLHQGTVWSWNRAIYDPHGAGHLRIELRALPAGPTVADMIGNAAFLVGLTLALAPELPRLLPGFTFGRARRNFYEAARKGLAAQLWWPGEASGPCPRLLPEDASSLCRRLLPLAEQALVSAGVEAAEASQWLSLVAERVSGGQTGAVWQRRTFERALSRGLSREQASQEVVTAYLERVAGGQPVHAWEPG